MKFYPQELRDLVKAWIAVSLAFTILYTNTPSFHLPKLFFISVFTVGIGFILHELGHKFIATRYHLPSYFRADNKMLLVMLAMSFFGFIFAAPGGVIFPAVAQRDKIGKIAFAGPFMNILLALFFLATSFLSPVFKYGFFINSWLALFNLIPFPGFDGFPVFRWNKIVYAFSLTTAAVLVLFTHL